jgi:hypothetical protein
MLLRTGTKFEDLVQSRRILRLDLCGEGLVATGQVTRVKRETSGLKGPGEV